MSLSALEIRNDLLSYVGIEDASQASGVIRRRVFNDVNAALQEIYTRGPAYLREKSFTAVLNGPRSVGGKTLTQFSTAMSEGDAVLGDMIGCTFRIDEETVDNEIVNATTLQNPFQGVTTASGSGTVFGDCVIFPENVAAVSGPVWLDGQYQLHVLSGRAELLNQITVRRTEIGQPRFYWVEVYGGELRLRVYPMPDRAYVLRYDAQLKAPQLDYATLWPEVEENVSANLIIDQVLTGLDVGLTGVISAADSILQAFGRLGNRVGALWGRNVFAGTGLTGGGDLSADRTLAVSFGSSVSTVCEGNDSRLSNARTPTAHASSHLNGGSDVLALTDAMEFLIDGGGVAITTGLKGYIEVPYACTITQATLLADQSGSIVVDVFKCTYANFDPTTHPASGDKITGSTPPTISSAKKSQDAMLMGWTTALSAGDILGFNVNSCTTITKAVLSLKITRS